MKSYRLIIQGRVQGVGFRYFVYQKARERGVKGRVRNLRDGGVEVVFSGDGKAANEFISQCRLGPPSARVLEFDITEIPPRDFEDFRIDR